jgi:ribosomal-protein-alanine N-acetyltransferase
VTDIRRFDCVRDTAIPLADLHKLCFFDPWDAEAIARLSGGSGFALLHGMLSRPEGFVIARVAADEAEILTIATHPEMRRRGIARALLHAASQEALARGAATMFLEVAASNAAAIALYVGAGFARSGWREGYYRVPGAPPGDALILKALLPLRPAAK